MIYSAGSLDIRNIGSSVSITLEDRVIHGAVATIEQFGDRTEIFLQHGEDPLVLDKDTPINVMLPSGASYAMHIRNAAVEIQSLLESVENMARKSRPELIAV